MILRGILLLLAVTGSSHAHKHSGYYNPRSSASAVANNTDWMKEVPGDILLSEMSFPGTHDTMAYSTSEPGWRGGLTNIWKTQAMSLREQLDSGIRALDIRCVNIDNKFQIQHGNVPLGPSDYNNFFFGEVLKKCNEFLDAHNQETILLKVKKEKGDESSSRSFSETFEWYMQHHAESRRIWDRSSSSNPNNPTLEDVRGKIVILQNFDEKYEFIKFQRARNVSDLPTAGEDDGGTKRNMTVYVALIGTAPGAPPRSSDELHLRMVDADGTVLIEKTEAELYAAATNVPACRGTMTQFLDDLKVLLESTSFPRDLSGLDVFGPDFRFDVEDLKRVTEDRSTKNLIKQLSGNLPRLGITFDYGIRRDAMCVQGFNYLDDIWDLYKKWTKVRQHLYDANAGDPNTFYMSFLSGATHPDKGVLVLPYFVASGHIDVGTSAARLATGKTTPGWAGSWKDFPRVNCFLGICTIANEGTNVLTTKFLRREGRLDYAPRMTRTGILYADFPGHGFIEEIINVNPKILDGNIRYAPVDTNPYPLVITNSQASQTDANYYYNDHNLYFGFSCAPDGSSLTIDNFYNRFSNRLLLNGEELHTQATPFVPIRQLPFASTSPLPPGIHSVTAQLDVFNQVDERGPNGGNAYELDNTLTRHFAVLARNGVELAPIQLLQRFGVPQDWSDALVISTESGTSTDAETITSREPLFIDFAIGNFGPTTTNRNFRLKLKVNGSTVLNGLAPTGLRRDTSNGGMRFDVLVVSDHQIAALPAGEHTLTLEIDTDNDFAESDENNNIYSRTFTVDQVLPIVGPTGLNEQTSPTTEFTATGYLNQPFSYQVGALNHDEFLAQDLPPGLSINSTTGIISGTPTAPGVFYPQIGARNADGDRYAQMAITIYAAPELVSPDSVVANQDRPFNFQLQADSATSFAINENLPPGLSLNPGTGEISGTPTQAGIFDLTLSATNPAGTTQDSLQLFIVAPGQIATTEDRGPGSLRNAYNQAAPDDTLTFHPILAGKQIMLTSGQLTIAKNLKINGTALAEPVAISAGNSSRLFKVNAGMSLRLEGLVLEDGEATLGGAVHNLGDLTLKKVTVRGCRADDAGGAIYNLGSLLVTKCTLMSNVADRGGAIQNSGSSADAMVRNSTFVGNTAFAAGGCFNNIDSATADFVHATIVRNIAESGQGGGIRNGSGSVSIENCIVSLNVAPSNPDLRFSITQHGGNLVGTDPRLAPLGAYGGHTLTFALLPGSPAIDAAPNPSPRNQDQRELPRTSGGAPDLGAFEFQAGADYWHTDYNQEGMSFGLAFALGMDPFGANRDHPGQPKAFLTANGQGFSFGVNFVATHGLIWIVERSPVLSPGSWEEVYRFDGSQNLETIHADYSANMLADRIRIKDNNTSPRPERMFHRLGIQVAP